MRVCVRVPPYARPRACAFVRACVQGKGAKGASNAGGACVRVPVRVCMRVCVCICAGVACVRDGVRADGAGNARAGRAGGRRVPVCVGVIVPLVCVRV